MLTQVPKFPKGKLQQALRILPQNILLVPPYYFNNYKGAETLF